MTIKTFAELATPDERSQRFSSRGFSPSYLLTPDSAAAHIQRTVDVTLDAAVPATMRDSYRRVCSTHVYGLFDYELFTVAGDLALLTLQQAFGERLISHYGGVIPIVDQAGTERPITAPTYEAVHAAFFEKDGSHRKGDWYIRSLKEPGERAPFRGALSQFFGWARMEGLLAGQRSKLYDRILVRMRNRAAHPISYKLSMPTDSALTIRDIGEFINRLWGARTPGGRIFPEPVRREMLVLGWAADGNSFMQQRPDQLIADDTHRDWTYLIVQAAPGDELVAFDADLETLRFSAHWLWGPGTYDAAVEWLGSAVQEEDEIDHLDRWFVVRVNAGTVDPPRNPDQFAGLPTRQRDGDWAVIRADYPLDAFNHARSLQTTGTECSTLGACERCWVETETIGTWDAINRRLGALKINLRARPPINVRVGYAHSRWEVWSAI